MASRKNEPSKKPKAPTNAKAAAKPKAAAKAKAKTTAKAAAKPKAAAKTTAKPRSARGEAASHEAIARRAYELSRLEGAGDAVSNWLRAERELTES